VVPTSGPNTAGALAHEALAAGADLVLALGGDGTVNEIVQGMVGSAVPLHILPAGTANVFGTETHQAGRPEQAAARLPECLPHRIALGRLTCDRGKTVRHFLLMAGVGLDAHIVYRVDVALKARAGKLAYWLAGFRMFGRDLAEFDAHVDGTVQRCSFLLASRVRNYGGDLEIARQTSLFDDRFEVVLFSGRQARRYIRYLLGILFGTLHGVQGVTVHRVSRVELPCPQDERVYVQVDGEFAGRLPATIEIVPDALTVLLPPDYTPQQ
jgi:diacylglycerol kinase family enzyme